MRSRLMFAVVGVPALVGGGWVGVSRFRQAQTTSDLPVAPARKGEFLAIIRCRGEIKAGRSAQLYAPIVPNLRIAWLAPSGEVVEEGAPVIRFDSSSAQQQLIQKEAALRQSQATLDQAVAQGRITAEQDQSTLREARFNLEKAQLRTATNEFVGRIEAEQNRIDVGVSEQKLKVQEATVEQHAASDKSKMASLTRQRDQAQADVDITKERLTQMEIKAPLTGVVVFQSNYALGSVNATPFKVGDNVYSGMNLGEIPDMTSLLIDVKVEEIDRGRIAVGDDVRILVDALPELAIQAKMTQISPMMELGLEQPITRSFRAYAAVAKADARLRPGMNGGMDIVVNRIPDAISIPAKALFTRAGKPVVFLAERGAYRLAEVQVLARNPDEVAISGIPAGALVALTDPEKATTKK
ncbi:MAG: efflux RND transporter periplasmic adaptor subunit [Acidobacteriia bacterium]|nr:efflux RND transporter periplasmic adaptor subunit [Terriglobia bacterium]